MPEFLSVFITASSYSEAETIARAVVEEKLAACANIFSDMKSIYRWQGQIEQAQECALILKTTADRFDALQTRVMQLHSYECPCIVATKIVAGNGDYLEWVVNSLKK